MYELTDHRLRRLIESMGHCEAPKGRKVIAQGIALGIVIESNPPCRGGTYRAFFIHKPTENAALSGLGDSMIRIPRALPWAFTARPVGAEDLSFANIKPIEIFM